jgi:hypothetical protein
MERTLKEAVVAYFKALSRNFTGWNVENHEKPQSG